MILAGSPPQPPPIVTNLVAETSSPVESVQVGAHKSENKIAEAKVIEEFYANGALSGRGHAIVYADGRTVKHGIWSNFWANGSFRLGAITAITRNAENGPFGMMKGSNIHRTIIPLQKSQTFNGLRPRQIAKAWRFQQIFNRQALQPTIRRRLKPPRMKNRSKSACRLRLSSRFPKKTTLCPLGFHPLYMKIFGLKMSSISGCPEPKQMFPNLKNKRGYLMGLREPSGFTAEFCPENSTMIRSSLA
ncbi:MAG: hypothetical protein PHV34_24270 [Verrucomicrobiae bacterium]|nr:hypothetical protein [Verrucomicrobiae bacterium]